MQIHCRSRLAGERISKATAALNQEPGSPASRLLQIGDLSGISRRLVFIAKPWHISKRYKNMGFSSFTE
jgi:hypothetical protein